MNIVTTHITKKYCVYSTVEKSRKMIMIKIIFMLRLDNDIISVTVFQNFS